MTILTMRPPLQIELLRQDSDEESTFSRCEPTKDKADAYPEEEEEEQYVEVSLVSDDDNSVTNISITSSDSSSFKAEKKVRFKNTTTVQDYLHFRDITKEEKADAWINYALLLSIKKEMLTTRTLMVEGKFHGDNLELTKRGLELRDRKLMMSCRFVVLQEQSRRQQGSFFMNTTSPHDDAIMIASRYGLMNSKAAAAATVRGRKDFEEVTNMYMPERIAREQREGFGFYDVAPSNEDDDKSDSSGDERFQKDE